MSIIYCRRHIPEDTNRQGDGRIWSYHIYVFLFLSSEAAELFYTEAEENSIWHTVQTAEYNKSLTIVLTTKFSIVSCSAPLLLAFSFI